MLFVWVIMILAAVHVWRHWDCGSEERTPLIQTDIRNLRMQLLEMQEIGVSIAEGLPEKKRFSAMAEIATKKAVICEEDNMLLGAVYRASARDYNSVADIFE